MVKAEVSDRVLCPDPGTLSLLPPVPRTGEVTTQGQWHLAFRPPATTPPRCIWVSHLTSVPAVISGLKSCLVSAPPTLVMLARVQPVEPPAVGTGSASASMHGANSLGDIKPLN